MRSGWTSAWTRRRAFSSARAAATATPTVLRFAQLPTETDLADAVASAPGYYTDPLGAADWRRAVSIELASRIRAELA